LELFPLSVERSEKVAKHGDKKIMSSGRDFAAASSPHTAGRRNNENKKNGVVAGSLQHKLELLEGRFTKSEGKSSPAAAAAAAAETVHSPATATVIVASNSQLSHSFGFDSPSVSYPSLATNSPSTSQQNSNGSHHPWTVVTEHMQKVAASKRQHGGESNDDSHPTVLTSHVRRKGKAETSEAQKQSSMEVDQKETPDGARSTAVSSIASSPAIAGIVMFVHILPHPLFLQQQAKGKRKSLLPVKREAPTVTQTQTSEEKKQPSKPKKERSRSNSSSAAAKLDNAETKKSPSGGEKRPVQASSPLRSQQSPANGTKRRRTTTASNSPLFHNNKEQSRDAAAKGSSKNQRKVVPANNRLIDDFFVSAVKKGNNNAGKKQAGTGATGSGSKEAGTAVTENSADPANASQKSSSARATSRDTQQQQQQQQAEFEQLKQRCFELEQRCQDKDEQLKAVSSTRCLAQSTLRSALKEREEDLAALQERQLRSRAVLEECVRTEAAQEARELRAKLAADGARLGRMVLVRAGGPLRRAAEAWEEGHASKQLQEKRATLASKRKTLEQRQEAALRASKRVWDAVKENSGGSGSDKGKSSSDCDAGDRNDETVGGVLVRTQLDAMEAVESVRFHLANIRRQEMEVAQEEKALNEEKGDHIRALKRVAAEDNSRFRSRPKLHDRYVLRCLLGKGGFSEVWRAYDLNELREVAVKIHQLDPRWPDAKKENYTKHVSREYEIHRNVRHPRIVSLFDVFEIDNNSFATVLECCDGTDLDTLLKSKGRLAERDARAILLQILSGMNYLSHPSVDGKRQGIIHYDLKPGTCSSSSCFESLVSLFLIFFLSFCPPPQGTFYSMNMVTPKSPTLV
jgi:tousled-like kinase